MCREWRGRERELETVQTLFGEAWCFESLLDEITENVGRLCGSGKTFKLDELAAGRDHGKRQRSAGGPASVIEQEEVEGSRLTERDDRAPLLSDRVNGLQGLDNRAGIGL